MGKLPAVTFSRSVIRGRSRHETPRTEQLGHEALEPRLACAVGDAAAALPPAFDIGSPQVVDLWVDPSRGSDTASGSTREAALRTLSEAWRRVPAGSTLATGVRINLAAGSYPESAVPNYWESRYGTASAPVIVRAADGTGTARLPAMNVFDCRSLYLVGLDLSAGGGDVLHLDHCQNVLVRDTTVRGTGDLASYASPQEALKANQCQNVFIEGCDISGGWDNAVDFVAVQHGHVINSRIHRSGDWAMYAKGGSADLTIAGNEFFDAGTGGFTAGQGTGFEFMVAPFLTYEASDIRFTGNVIHDVDGAGMGVNGGFNILMASNTLYRVGARSHVIEVVQGSRSCDGDVATCTRWLAAGGWGTNRPGSEEPIPNRNVFIYNNVVFNPDGYASQWQQFTVAGPRTPSPGSNIPSPARADDNLQLRGNVIWNGPADHPLGIESAALASDILAHNAINTVRPRLIDPAHGDYRLDPSFARPATYEIPPFPGAGDPPTPPNPGTPPASPRVASLTLPAGATYRRGERLVFQMVFTEPVRVTGSPRFQFTVGSASRRAFYSGGSGTTTLSFVYTVSRRDVAPDGITVGDRLLLPRGASVRTFAGIDVLTQFAAVDGSGVKVAGRAVRTGAP